MSIASYIFTGTRKLAENGEGQPDTESQMLFYGVMFTSIEPLFGILNDGEKISLNEISKNDEYTSMTFGFPIEFVVSLSNVDITGKEHVIKAWMKDEDCPYDNESDISDLFLALVKLSKHAIDNDEQLFLRMEM